MWSVITIFMILVCYSIKDVILSVVHLNLYFLSLLMGKLPILSKTSCKIKVWKMAVTPCTPVARWHNVVALKFLLNLDPIGTKFQKLVWRHLEKIPFGEVVSYGKIADIIGNPKACRAVGSANGKNPISIIIPCHRVIGSDGSLTGYGGGLWRKEWLIKHEKGYHPNNIIA